MNLEGTRLGKYEIRSEIGAGAMGVVYQAHDPVLNRSVAVKVLFPHLTRNRDFVERFLREARAAAALKHPNIVTVYDAGDDGGWYYFVMEYLEGRPLSAVLREQGRLSPEEALPILNQLADALDYAHQEEMVHRDVKPANAMVDNRGHLTLTDFGLVRAAQESRMTATGTVMGTPHYMSPEQASGKKTVGPASDLYSLGVMAYEMLCGEVPFDTDSTPAILHMQVYDPPPPICPKCPNLPPAVDKVLTKALAKDPSERYSSGAEFAAALSRALEREVVPAPSIEPTVVRENLTPSGRPPAYPLPWPWIAGGLTALALAVVLLLMVFGGGGEEDTETSPRVTSAPTDVAVGVFVTSLAVDTSPTATSTFTATRRPPTATPTVTVTPRPPMATPTSTVTPRALTSTPTAPPPVVPPEDTGPATIWSETFSYADEVIPADITTFTMDGTFWSLFVEGGKLKAKMGTDSYSNIGRVFWWPNDVVFGKGDSLTLEYEGFEMSGYHTGNWDCMVQVTPIDAPMDQIHTIPEIYVRTQSRGDTAILVIDAQGNGDRIASQMYPVSDGIHTYKLELNNVGGEYQLGALQFYRDGVLEASSDNVTAHLDELNAVRFYMLNADPEGIKIHTWDNMRIEITKQNSAPLLADFQVSVSADEGEVITNSSQ